MKSFFLLLSLTTVAPGFAWADTLPVISLDANHNEKVTAVSSDDYTASLTQLMNTINASTLSAIQNREQNATQAAPKTVWMLRDVTVGLGTQLTVGISHIWSMSFAPRVRFGYSDSTHPKSGLIMKTKVLFLAVGLLALSGCNSKGPVPDEWFMLPEQGEAKNPGSMDKLGTLVDSLFKAHADALDQLRILVGIASS